MNNKDNNLIYKEKYLKYKHKYLQLKNISGGKLRFNSDLTRCEDDKTPREFNAADRSFYNAANNKCCKTYKDDKYDECDQIVHTIDHAKIPSESGLKIDKYIFNTDDNYIGNTPIFNTIIKANIYEQFIYKTDKFFNKTITLGSGSYGEVIQYYDSINEKYIAVKYGDIKDEKAIIQRIKNAGNLCSELVVKYIMKEDCIIMENAIGTIDKLKPLIEKNTDILIDILYAVVIAIQCLHDIGIYYYDIKMQNILYRDTEDGIQIILGDLGGAVGLLGSARATYHPYESKYDDNAQGKRSIISWGIGILTLSLLNIDHESICIWIKKNWSKKPELLDNDKYIKDEVAKIIIELTNKGYSNIIKLIEKTLCNYKDRWNLSQIVEFLNTLRIQHT